MPRPPRLPRPPGFRHRLVPGLSPGEARAYKSRFGGTFPPADVLTAAAARTGWPSVTIMRRLPVAAACGLALCGCEVRDEVARSGPPTAWLERMALRLESGTADPLGRPADSGGPECLDGFAAGARRAADGGLPMLLIFRAGWCRWSGDILETILADERLAAAAGRIVCVSVDADREADVCRRFGVGSFPTVIVLGPDRRERYRATGAAARRGLAAALQAATGPRVAGLPAADPR